MPRIKQTELEREFISSRWRTFGAYLRQRRHIRGATQEEIAAMVGVTRWQWLRYEKGAKMLKKHMRAAAIALNVPYNTMLDRAGYKVLPMINDIKCDLAKISDHLKAGKLDLAILELLRLNDRLRAEGRPGLSVGGGEDATHFANAIVSTENTTPWLSELAVRVIEARSYPQCSHATTGWQPDPEIIEQCVKALSDYSLPQPAILFRW